MHSCIWHTSGICSTSCYFVYNIFNLCKVSRSEAEKQQHTIIVHGLQIIYRSHVLNVTSCQSVHRKCTFYVFNVKFNVAFEEPFSCSCHTNATDVMVHYFSCFLLLKKFYFILHSIIILKKKKKKKCAFPHNQK